MTIHAPRLLAIISKKPFGFGNVESSIVLINVSRSVALIVGILKEHKAGIATKDLCRKHGVSPVTFYAWKAKYGGMEVSDVAKIKALEDDNRSA